MDKRSEQAAVREWCEGRFQAVTAWVDPWVGKMFTGEDDGCPFDLEELAAAMDAPDEDDYRRAIADEYADDEDRDSAWAAHFGEDGPTPEAATVDDLREFCDSEWITVTRENPREFYEFYQVNHGAPWIEEAGGILIEGPYGPIWCRETTGQAVYLDGEIVGAYRLDRALALADGRHWPFDGDPE
jgi:hypothetical protein